MVFPFFMYGCESWTIKKAELRRIHAFEVWCWTGLLRVPWTARRANQSILKEIPPGCSLEGLMLKLKLQYFGYLMWKTHSLQKPWCWERLKAGGEGDDRGWDGWWLHQSDGHEFEQALGFGDGQGSLVRCSPRGHKVSDITERLNWTVVCMKAALNLCSLVWCRTFLELILLSFQGWVYFISEASSI